MVEVAEPAANTRKKKCAAIVVDCGFENIITKRDTSMIKIIRKVNDYKNDKQKQQVLNKARQETRCLSLC